MSEKQQTVKAELATVQQRIFAGLIDWAIIVVFIFLLELIPMIFGWVATSMAYNGNASGAAIMVTLASVFYAILSIVSLLLALFYFVWRPMNKNGQTVGKKHQNIQIAVIEDEAKGKVRPVAKGDLVPLLIRWLLMCIDGILFGLVGYFFITNSPNRQRLGDQLAKTVVVDIGKAPAPKTTTAAPAKKTTTTTAAPAKKTTTTTAAPAKKTTTTTKKE
ncbi:MAG: RDD family protein [Candidatus Heimdallarchaeota archaeon]|nr:RDD family protein [Candidatus Heimdallarchaeota archaeon]